jgi:hypothetical protein
MSDTQGAVSLDELARELDMPKALIREWLYEFVRTSEFTGHINSDREMVYSREARRLAAGGTCPQLQRRHGTGGQAHHSLSS